MPKDKIKLYIGIGSIIPSPVFGPICGPSDKPIAAYAIPDAYRFHHAFILFHYADFTKACQHHDDCWGLACNKSEAAECDKIFGKDLKQECDETILKLDAHHYVICYAIAEFYRIIVEDRREKSYSFPLKKDLARCIKQIPITNTESRLQFSQYVVQNPRNHSVRKIPKTRLLKRFPGG